MRRVIRALQALAFAAFVTLGSCGAMVWETWPLRWIDTRSYDYPLLWNQALRWNYATGTWAFRKAEGIGTELRPKPSWFWYIPTCDSWGENIRVNGCVDDHRDIWYRTDKDYQYETELVLHELGHTEGPGWHHGGRGVMADESMGGTPTGCITMDDLEWLCDHWDYTGKYSCGALWPEC